MTKRIEILPESVQHMIAAGEVVEGPFSVIKELMENSIDSGAGNIYVEAEDSGFKKILIRDDGSGIYKDDIRLSVTEHATSKISSINDILKISSLGFRGEALSSISSISKLTIFSRTKEETIGGKVLIDNGKINETDYAGPSGTTVIVENLFYNTPARKKFLKSKSVESRIIREVFTKISQAYPQIEFTLVLNGKKPLILRKSESQAERLKQVYGKDVVDNLYYESLEDFKVRIEGFLSNPGFLKSSRSMQFIYVNNRPVEIKNAGFLLTKAYEAIAARGQYPAAFIFITINPDLIDINIHPAKREVKFFDQKYVNDLIYALAKKVLGRQEHRVSFDKGIFKEEFNIEKSSEPVSTSEETVSHGSIYNKIENNNDGILYHKEQDNINLDSTTVNDRTLSYVNKASEDNSYLDFDAKRIISESRNLYRSLSDDSKAIDPITSLNILGIVFGTYILVEDDDKLKIIDYHAAHERIIYDKILSDKVELEIQEFIFPMILEFSIVDYEILLDNIEFFKDKGFDIDDMGDNSVAVRSVPVLTRNINMENVIRDMVETLKNEEDHFELVNKKIASSMACHSAKRANEKLTFEDAKYIVDLCFSGKHELRCPHGRPFIYNIEQRDFEKMFKRSL